MTTSDVTGRSTSLEVTPVVTARSQREFIDLPFRLYAGDRHWVAPLIGEQRAALDTRRNPFFEHAEARYFLARRGGRVVGRISAHVDRHFNRFHSTPEQPDRSGFWGFFECEDDPAAARELFDAAADWLAARGCTAMIGPASFTLNDEAGLLVDGFDAPPVLMMTYNPAYYARLIELAGFEKAHDLFAYRLETSADLPADVRAFAADAERDFTFRHMDLRDFDREVLRVMEIYNEAWERNWGFCPMTESEIRVLAKKLKPIVDPNLVIVAERGDEPVAIGLTLPDVNEALIELRGRYRPIPTAKLLYRIKRRRWTKARVVILGVKRDYRETGIGAHLYVDTMEAARRGGYRWGEMSWILESNEAMNRAIRHMGGTVYKTYRMYARPVG